MKVRYSNLARRDLFNILYQGELNFGRVKAKAYSDKLEKAVKRFGIYPEIARLRSEMKPPVRIFPVGSHVIIYQIADGVCVIIRILHGHQNLEDHL